VAAGQLLLDSLAAALQFDRPALSLRLQYCRPAAAALLLRPALLMAIIGWNSRFICT
jgi:hypothetical protein